MKGAAWSIPVIAATVASPAFAASTKCPTPTLPWDVAITGGCMIDFWGAGQALPGFTVTSAGTKDANGCCLNVAPDSPLTITETAKGVWHIDIPDVGGLLYAAWTVAPLGGIALAAPFEAWAFAYAAALVAALIIPSQLAGYGPYITAQNWVKPTSVGQFLGFSVTPQVVGSGFSRVLRVNVTFSFARQLTINGMPSCSQTGWGYLGGVVTPSPSDFLGPLTSIPLFGAAISSAAGTFTPDLSLTASGAWTDANPGNNIASIGNQILAPGACQ